MCTGLCVISESWLVKVLLDSVAVIHSGHTGSIRIGSSDTDTSAFARCAGSSWDRQGMIPGLLVAKNNDHVHSRLTQAPHVTIGRQDSKRTRDAEIQCIGVGMV